MFDDVTSKEELTRDKAELIADEVVLSLIKSDFDFISDFDENAIEFITSKWLESYKTAFEVLEKGLKENV